MPPFFPPMIYEKNYMMLFLINSGNKDFFRKLNVPHVAKLGDF